MTDAERVGAGVKRRAGVLLAGFALWGVAIEARLVQLQVFKHDELVRQALSQHHDWVQMPALRGDITDRDGRVLAYSVDASSVLVFPKQITDPGAAASALCQALADCAAADRADLAAKMTTRRSPFYVRRARDVTQEQVRRIEALKLAFVQIVPENQRFYPNFDLAAHVLGFVDQENKGGAGVESMFNREIRGQDGRMLVQVDGRSKRMQARVDKAATSGATVELTLDLRLQDAVERELQAGVLERRAQAGTAIVMDPLTGEILALANYPTFNPNSYWRAPDTTWRNRAVQEVYEPGSTFKIVTAAAAIEEGVIQPYDLIDCRPGRISVGSRVIPEAGGHNYGVLTFEDVIAKSSNVGAIKTGLQIGGDRLSRYVRRFGFGEVLGGDFGGQSAGKVWGLSTLDDSALASMSMGYQVSVTPLQMALAASAVANGGLLLEPHVVRAIVRGGERQVIAPKVVRRAITAETAAALTIIMETVVQRGTARTARLDRYDVAGKTGTTEKIVDGRYSNTDYNASFVGFVPSRRPAFTILVVIDTPRKGHYGGDVAGPIFKRIAEAAIRHAGLPPSINRPPPIVVTPPDADPAMRPARATMLPSMAALGGRALVPDVRGLGAREALQVLSKAGLFVHVQGAGIVSSQTPAPGEVLEPGAWSVLQLRREPAAAGAASAKGGGR